MTSEFLLDAIGQMDDELVMEAAEPTRRAIPWLKVSGWAAALLLCVGVASLPDLMPQYASGGVQESDSVFENFTADMELQDGTDNKFEYRSEQESQVKEPSAANKTESATADATSQGIMEPQFFTERGVYMLIGDEFPYKPKMPDTEPLKELGVLVAAVPGKQVYPATRSKDYVGCPVWESADGKTLYIKLPDGGCLFATLYE